MQPTQVSWIAVCIIMHTCIMIIMWSHTLTLFTYTVTFEALNGATFRGFFIQARTLADDSQVGAFEDPQDSASMLARDNAQLSSCTPPEIGVTHSNNDNGNVTDFAGDFVFRWTAPPAGTGTIQFVYTSVQVFNTFWVMERTSNIQGTLVSCG